MDLVLPCLKIAETRLAATTRINCSEFAQQLFAWAIVIDDMLRLARIARSEVSCEDVSISQLAQEVVSQLRASEPRRKVTINIAPDLKAIGDRHLLRAVLENLLGNAWKFTSKRRDAYIEIGAREGEKETVFFVRDNGSGFDMRYADKLFGVFQRLDTDREYAGTGVGLATVQRIVHKHGGRVWAEAEVEKRRHILFCFALTAVMRECLGEPRLCLQIRSC